MEDDMNVERLPSGNPIERRVLISRGLTNHPNAVLEYASDGYRIYVRQAPKLSVNIDEEWLLIWDHKQFDVPSFLEPILNKIFGE